MDKIAFIFPGQGAQYPGMGKTLYNSERRIFDKADEFRPGITKICFEGSPEDLKKTVNTQPCLYIAELAAANSLIRGGVKPDALAGFSLGEITALAVGGAYTYDEGFEIVCRRGELMAKCAEKLETGMLAVLKIEREEVERICNLHQDVYAVNYNCPGQIAVAGVKSELEAAKADFIDAGAKVIPLAVSGGFHSPFMDDAAAEFGKFLNEQEIGNIEIPVWADCNAGLYTDGEVWSLMERQINHPVLWENLINNMHETGINTFIEVGPGQVLSKLVKKILPDAKIYHAETAEEINAVINEVN